MKNFCLSKVTYIIELFTIKPILHARSMEMKRFCGSYKSAVPWVNMGYTLILPAAWATVEAGDH